MPEAEVEIKGEFRANRPELCGCFLFALLVSWGLFFHGLSSVYLRRSKGDERKYGRNQEIRVKIGEYVVQGVGADVPRLGGSNMRKLTLSASLGVFGLLGLSAFADVTKEELKKLASAGVSEEVILSYIRTNGPVVKLTSDDLVELKQAGLGDRALAAAAAGTVLPAPAPSPAPPPTTIVESVVSPPVTYYSTYERPYVYSPSYSFGLGAYYYPRHSHYYSHHHSSHHGFREHHGGHHYGGHGGHQGGGHHRGGHGGRH